MTTLTHLSTNAFSITRLVATTGYKKEYTTTTADIKGNLQPASDIKTQLFDGVVGKTYVCFLDGTMDVVEGDRLRDTETGSVYQVMTGGVSRRTHGAIDYLEVTVQLIN